MACQTSGEVFRGDEFVQIDFGDELKRIYVYDRKCYRYRMTINNLSCQGHIGVMVATEMVMVGVGMLVRGTRRAMAGSLDMQKTNFYVMGSRKPCFFDLMGNRKDGIGGKADNHRYQS